MKAFTKKFAALLVFATTIVVFIISPAIQAELDVKGIFNSRCAKCHGPAGKITKRGEELGARNFNDINWQKSITDEEIFNVITNGKNKMPSWKDKLGRDEIKGLVHYVRVLLPHGQRDQMPKDIRKLHYDK